MKSPRTFPKLVMKEWVQKKSLAQSGDRDMTQDAHTELDALLCKITDENRHPEVVISSPNRSIAAIRDQVTAQYPKTLAYLATVEVKGE